MATPFLPVGPEILGFADVEPGIIAAAGSLPANAFLQQIARGARVNTGAHSVNLLISEKSRPDWQEFR